MRHKSLLLAAAICVFLCPTVASATHEVLSIGGSTCVTAARGETVQLPVTILESGAMPPGASLPAPRIRAFRFRVVFSPADAVDVGRVSVSQPGNGDGSARLWSTSRDAVASSLTHIAAYDGERDAGVVAFLDVPIALTAREGTTVSVAVDPNYTSVSHEPGSGRELAVAGGCIMVPAVCNPAAITVQPLSKTIPYRGWTTLTVTYSGDAPVTLQWYRGASGDTSVPVSGATAASFTTPALTSATNYWVRVTNACATVNSKTATIALYPAYKDVLKLGSGMCVAATPGKTAQMPVYIQDVANTVLGADAGAMSPVLELGFDVQLLKSGSPFSLGEGLSVSSNDWYMWGPPQLGYVGNSVWYRCVWSRPLPNMTSPVAFVNMQIPSYQMPFGKVDVVFGGSETYCWLGDGLGELPNKLESAAKGNLSFVNGCIEYSIPFTLSCPGPMIAGSNANATITTPSQTVSMTANLSSSNTSVATVPAMATIPMILCTIPPCPDVRTLFKVTAVGAGTSTITVSIPTLASSRTCTVTVIKPAITLTPATATTSIGKTQAYTVSITPAQATATTVTLASTNTTAVTVPASVSVPAGTSATFNATAKAAGTSTITATLPASLASGNATATLTVEAPCTAAAITKQPASVTIASGAATTLGVTATGSDLHYEWYEGAAPATTKRVGTDAPSFTTPWLTATTKYWVRVKNSCSSVDSATATVTVTAVCAPPAITKQPASVTIGIGESTTLSVTATGSSPLTYRWYRGTPPDVTAPVGTNAAALSTGALRTTTSFWVRVVSSCGTTLDSAAATVTVVCRKPQTTIARVVAEGQSNIPYTVSWNATAGVTKYEVQESRRSDFATTESLKTISGLSTTYTHTVSGSDATFYYRVRGIADCDGSKADYSSAVAIVVEPEPEPETGTGQGQGGTAQYGANETHTFSIQVKPKSGKTNDPLDTSFVVSTTAAFLKASPSSGTMPSTGTIITVTAASSGLPLGANTGTVNVTTTSGAPIAGVPVWLSLVTPVQPTPRAVPTATTLIVPAVAHVDTPTTQFVSDVRVANISTQPIDYLVSFTPSGVNGIAAGKQTPIKLAAGQTVALDDVAKAWFGESANSGSLEIRPTTAGVTAAATIATSRTYAKMPNGTYGQFIPAVPASEFVGKGHVLSLQQIAQSPAFRTNIGIVEGAGQTADVKIAVFNAAGAKLKEFALTPSLQPLEFRPINRILEAQGVPVVDGRLEVSVTSATGKIAAYASVLDNRTEDPFCVSAVEAATIRASRYVVPGVADIRSGGLNWRSDLRIYNAATAAVTVTIAFYPDDAPERPVTKTATIAAGEMKVLDNVLQSFFGVAPDRKGAVHVTTAAASSLVVTARTYFVSAAGTYGQFIPGVTATEGVAKGGAPIQLLQLEESPRYRTNVGVTELTGNPATVEITAYVPGETGHTLTPLALKPYQTLQISRILKQVSTKDVYNARISIRVADGAGRVAAYASVVDAGTSDPTYVPAQ